MGNLLDSLPEVLALWFGILTSISPCGLATNIAALSFVSRKVEKPALVLFASILYALGRTITYLALASLIVAGLLSVPGAARFLQSFMNKLLGPLFIVAAMFLLELLTLNLPSASGERLKAVAEKGGLLAPLVLGILLAMTFCPVGIGLFFGALIPLAVEHDSRFVIPMIYGLGTALPVVAFAMLGCFGLSLVSTAFTKTVRFELWARRITGILFLLVGFYLSLKYVHNVPMPF